MWFCSERKQRLRTFWSFIFSSSQPPDENEMNGSSPSPSIGSETNVSEETLAAHSTVRERSSCPRSSKPFPLRTQPHLELTVMRTILCIIWEADYDLIGAKRTLCKKMLKRRIMDFFSSTRIPRHWCSSLPITWISKWLDMGSIVFTGRSKMKHPTMHRARQLHRI